MEARVGGESEMTKKVAIIGSEEKYFTSSQRTDAVKKMRDILVEESCPKDMLGDRIPFEPDAVILISGGCPKGGIDIWAEIIAYVLGIKKVIFYPEVNQWEDQYVCVNNNKSVQMKLIGYESRNIQIAEACDVLYCIDPKGRKRSGGRFTMEAARKLGKEVHLVEIE